MLDVGEIIGENVDFFFPNLTVFSAVFVVSSDVSFEVNPVYLLLLLLLVL